MRGKDVERIYNFKRRNYRELLPRGRHEEADWGSLTPPSSPGRLTLGGLTRARTWKKRLCPPGKHLFIILSWLALPSGLGESERDLIRLGSGGWLAQEVVSTPE